MITIQHASLSLVTPVAPAVSPVAITTGLPAVGSLALVMPIRREAAGFVSVMGVNSPFSYGYGPAPGNSVQIQHGDHPHRHLARPAGRHQRGGELLPEPRQLRVCGGRAELNEPCHGPLSAVEAAQITF